MEHGYDDDGHNMMITMAMQADYSPELDLEDKVEFSSFLTEINKKQPE